MHVELAQQSTPEICTYLVDYFPIPEGFGLVFMHCN